MWNGDINNIEEVVTYLNNELSKGRTQKEIEINDFKVNERVIAKRLTSRGYKKVNNEYIKYDNSNTIVSRPNINKYDDSNTIVINQKEIQNKLIGLAQNYDKILKIIQEYDYKYDDKYDNDKGGIFIELPIESKNDFRATIRVNNVIWEQFSEFANNHKEFTKRDLISMALKEYMDKYK